MTPDIDCQDCGACCAAFVVDVFADDYDRMPYPRRNLLVVQDASGYYEMRMTKRLPSGGGRCAALAGKPGERCSCTIYDVRPTVCRDYEPELTNCNRARARIGLPALEVK